ncbi:WSC-domain-containing protein [Venturia nashicola]|uniref:WSC-domain-containing protein n=1 Tax=Venturia nashicola TaxID=86259 RepID=A0A4Z1PBV7_9PEZI|nr:WSC-domain-containing protein [Venturia nashicola]TLD38192.1 WSC-domain-containing protein [Venturia nashicola]
MTSYLGCYRDKQQRLLDGAFTNKSSMAAGVCEEYCSTISSSSYYPLFGLEYGSQCYCGSSFAHEHPERVEEYWCGVPCMGKTSEICGGTWYISVYNITSPPKAKTVATTSTAPTSTPLSTSSSSTVATAQNSSGGLDTASSHPASVAGSRTHLVPQTTVIAIGIVAALFAVALLGVIAYLAVFRRRWKKHLEAQQEREIASTMNITSATNVSGKTDMHKERPPAEMWVDPAEMPAEKSSPGSPRVTLPPIPPHSPSVPSVTKASINSASYPIVPEHYHDEKEH